MAFGDQRRLEVGDVVDACDHGPTVALLEYGDRGVLNPEWEEAAARTADDPLQSNLYHPAMGDDQNVAVLVTLENVIDRRRDPPVKGLRTLAAGNDIPVGLFDPARPGFGESLSDVIGAQPFPIAEVDLPQRRRGLRLGTDRRRDGPSGFESSLEVAGVEAGEMPAAEAPAEPVRLEAPLIREGRVELALDSAFTVPGRLPMANQEQTCGGWWSWSPPFAGSFRRKGIWELRRGVRLGPFRARRSDFDIYTNFLLTEAGHILERTLAVTRLFSRNTT